MKNFLLTIIAFTTLFFACNSNPTSKLSKTDSVKNSNSVNELNTVKNIPLIKAETMVHNYKAHAEKDPVPHISDSRFNKNSRCVWFQIDTLLKFVNQIKKEDGDGVRIYFATYSDNEPEPTNRSHPSFKNYNTLVLISTKPFKKPDINHHHLDYYNNIAKSAFLSEPQNKGELYPPGQDEGALFLQNNGFH